MYFNLCIVIYLYKTKQVGISSSYYPRSLLYNSCLSFIYSHVLIECHPGEDCQGDRLNIWQVPTVTTAVISDVYRQWWHPRLSQGHGMYTCKFTLCILHLRLAIYTLPVTTLQWRHHEHRGVSNHQPHDCLLNHLFRRRSKKTSKLCVTGLCEGNSPVTDEFPAQRASNVENVSIWWRHHEYKHYWCHVV